LEPARIDIRKLSKSELDQFIVDKGLPKFKSNQIWEWIWKKRKTDFQSMRNLPKDLISALEENFLFNSLTLDKQQISSDGTVKNRFALHDGHLIESVLIPVVKDKRFTVCVSSQVGCSLTCSFCATGKMKRIRNLDAAEIYDQVVKVDEQCQEIFDNPLTNIVYMGMGEPLLNYQNVLKSVDRLCAPDGLNMSPKRITVSTVGLSKQIRRLADDGVKFNLALSLHAPTDAQRNQIMPINEQNDLNSLIDSLKYFYEQTKNRISFEYISFNGFNDTASDARNLVKLTRFFPVKVNIIEYNSIDGVEFEKSDSVAVDHFAQILRDANVMVTVRRSRGKDIDAACGQLANKG